MTLNLNFFLLVTQNKIVPWTSFEIESYDSLHSRQCRFLHLEVSPPNHPTSNNTIYDLAKAPPKLKLLMGKTESMSIFHQAHDVAMGHNNQQIKYHYEKISSRYYLWIQEGSEDGNSSSKSVNRLNWCVEDDNWRNYNRYTFHGVSNAECQRRDLIQRHVWNLIIQVIKYTLSCHPPVVQR